MKVRSNGVIKLAFNGKSRNNSLFTYNLQKETHEQLVAKLREKIVDFLSFYSEFNNKAPIRTFEAYSSDFLCTTGCKIDLMSTKVSVVGIVFKVDEIKQMLHDESKKFGIEIDVNFN